MGRQLASFDGITYTYNEDGIRTSKTVNGERTYYYVDGTQLFEQTIGNDCGLHFFYDRNGELTAFARYYEDDEPIQDLYYYVKNARGDIIDIADDWGNIIASYTYDPWGKILSVTGTNTTIGNLNPFRYRSYYYDSDIQMYYLQSRYYDPEVGRFINCDDVNYLGATGTQLSYNAFAYCENEPVNNSDANGFWGADIHYGRKYTNKEYVNKNNQYIIYDGTYEWAKAMGFKTEYAHILADACRLVDKSLIYGPVIPTSNGFGHHFNFSYSRHTEDTRIMFANKWLLKAINIFNSNPAKKKKREEAFKILGRGLHALQDYSAHGDFVPIEVMYFGNATMSGATTAFLIQVHSKEYDDPFFDWKNTKKRSSFGSKLLNVGLRYRETKIQTIIYLTSFLVSIKERNLKYIYNQ